MGRNYMDSTVHWAKRIPIFCLEGSKNRRKEIVIHGDRIILCATFGHFISILVSFDCDEDLWLELIQLDACSFPSANIGQAYFYDRPRLDPFIVNM